MRAGIVRRPSQVFYGWWIVAAGSVVHALGGGLSLYGFSVLLLPVSESLNASRGALSAVFALSRAEGAFEGPIAGYLVDRLGPRRLVFWGAVTVGVGYIVLSRMNSFTAFLLVYLGIISLGFNAGFIHPIMATVNSWFVRHRALALGVVASAFGLGGSVVAPLLGVGIELVGWRTAIAISGVVILLGVTPMAFFIYRTPESRGLLPDGGPPAGGTGADGTQARPQDAAPSTDYTLREALQTRAFWVLTAATTLRIGLFIAVVAHFVGILDWLGMGRVQASLLLGFIAAASIPGRIGLGWIGDRLPKVALLAGSQALGVLALLLLGFGGLGATLWLAVLCLTLMESVNPLNWALLGDLFGRKAFATIRGFMSFFYSWGAVALPYFAGAVFDRTGSYRPVLVTFAALFAVAGVIYAGVQRPRQRKAAAPAAIGA